MQQVKLNKKAIKDYIIPEIENLKALLKSFHFEKSLKVLVFLDYILDCEISNAVEFENKVTTKSSKK